MSPELQDILDHLHAEHVRRYAVDFMLERNPLFRRLYENHVAGKAESPVADPQPPRE
jgi:hypothetical protein